jgi:hypothetical protein
VSEGPVRVLTVDDVLERAAHWLAMVLGSSASQDASSQVKPCYEAFAYAVREVADTSGRRLMRVEHERDRALVEVENLTCECVRLRETLEAVLDGIRAFASVALEVTLEVDKP